jgi:nitroreductase
MAQLVEARGDVTFKDPPLPASTIGTLATSARQVSLASEGAIIKRLRRWSHARTPDAVLGRTAQDHPFCPERLDFTRPVKGDVLEECLTIAQQAPTGSNWQNWHFVVVTDSAKRAALAELYRKGWDIYTTLPFAASNLTFENAERNTIQARVMASAQYLADHMHQAPVHVIPCIALPGDRVERQSARVQSALWGSIEQAGRSFMLAARARGLGTTWTCLHLFFEEEAVQLLGHPLCRGRPGSPDPGSLHERHTVQASTSGTPPHDGPLGGLVGQPS